MLKLNFCCQILSRSEIKYSYFRTEDTIRRKKHEAEQKRREAQSHRRKAAYARERAKDKQRDEEMMDRKAEDASRHAEELRRQRQFALDRIAGYHRHIDNCTAEMSEKIAVRNKYF